MSWITLADVKAHLNKNTTVDDTELQGFIPAACAIIEDLKGHVDQVTVTQSGVWSRWANSQGYYPYGYYRWAGPIGRRDMIELIETPILSVTSVSLLGGSAPVPISQADPDTGALGWWLQENVLYVAQRGQYDVTYVAGRNPVPDNYRLAALELVVHLWRGSQTNQNQAGRPPLGGDQQQIMPRIASALPYRVRELLGIYGNVVNEHVVIA